MPVFFYIIQILLLLWPLSANYLLYRRCTPLLPEAPFKISVHWSSSFFFQIRTWLENGLTIAGWLCLKNPSGRWRRRGRGRSNLRKWSKRQVVHLWQLASSARFFFFLRPWKSMKLHFFFSWKDSVPIPVLKSVSLGSLKLEEFLGFLNQRFWCSRIKRGFLGSCEFAGKRCTVQLSWKWAPKLNKIRYDEEAWPKFISILN